MNEKSKPSSPDEKHAHDDGVEAINTEATEPQTDNESPVQMSVDSGSAGEAENKILRLQADMDNLRRRTRREMEDALRYASLPLLNDLLDTIDNLDRALSSAESSDANEGLLEGVKMVRSQLESILEKHGCTKIVSVGAEFDPNLHEAVQMQPSDQPANTVIQELRAGYKLRDRVIRPSQVFISQP